MNTPEQFEADALMQQARDQTGLSDFGDPAFIEGLTAFCNALETDARLSDFGRQLLHQKILELLSNRLGIEDWYRRHPEIDNETLAPPLVIVGLPRTGTTLLQRILSCDPQFYTMQWWETRYPVPFPGESLETPTQRQQLARAEVKVMVEAMPKLLTIHPMDADQADEEVMLMEHSFVAAMNTYAHIPGYLTWLAQTDERSAYTYLRRMLKFLQWQQRQRGIVAQRWVLKAPHHLLRMHLLLELFPGVKVIQTHRDPIDTIPSIASFLHTLWSIYSSDARKPEAGAEWSDLMARALAHTMAIREQAPERFFDVQFRDTVKRPFEVVEDIYRFADLPLSPKAIAAMQSWMDRNRREERGSHDYEMQDFGLSEAQIKRDFAVYREHYVEAQQH